MNNLDNHTFRTIQLIKVVDHEYNDRIGGNINSYLDGSEYHAYTLEELIEEITNYILTCDTYLEMENTKEVVEAKHIRFLGKEEIEAVVSMRCKMRKEQDRKWEWE